MDEGDMAELVDSIRKLGFIDPLTVFSKGDRYEVTDGHRRYLAAKEAGLFEVPCIVTDAKPGVEMEAQRLHLNLHEAMNPADEAIYYQQLQEKYGIDFMGLVQLTRRSEKYVSDRINLFKAEPEVFDALQKRCISLSQCLQIQRVNDRKMAFFFLDQAMRLGIGAQALAVMITNWKAQGEQTPSVPIPANTGPAAEMPQPEPPRCAVCLSTEFTTAMRMVPVHDWELKWLNEALEAIRKGGEKQQ